MIIDIHDVWHAAFVQHEKYVRTRMLTSLNKLYRIGPPTAVLAQVQAFLSVHETEIVSAASRNFAASVQDYDLMFPPGTEQRAAANELLKRIFDYDAFRNANSGWNAYALCASSPYEVCPYCHITSTKTVIKNTLGSGYRPQLDHFIGRADYPFLGLSLGNFVPSCGTCNGPGMKHSTNVLTVPHLSPLVDPSVLTFKLRPKNAQPWSPLLQSLRVPMSAYEIVIDVPSGNVAADNSLRTFQLRSRYQSYVHDAYRLAKIGRNPAWLQTLASTLRLTPTVQDQLGFSTANGCMAFKNTPQGKMRMDVYHDSRTW